MNYVESFNLLGVEARQIPNITGEGAPTITTEGAVGCLYMDILTGDIYKCTAAIDDAYTWIRTLDENDKNELAEDIAEKFDKKNVVQTTGNSETAVMSQKAVTDLHNDLFEFRCKNYLDPSKRKTGMIHTNGQIYTGGSYDAYSYYEEYIPVSEGDVISIQSTYLGDRYSSVDAENNGYTCIARFIAYDVNKNVLPELGYVQSTNDGIDGRYYTVPAGVSFVNFTFSNSVFAIVEDITILKNATTVMPFFEYGETKALFKSDYIPIDSIISDVDDQISSFKENLKIGLEDCTFTEYENLFDINTVKIGYYVDPTWGVEVENENYLVSEFIEVEPNTNYAFYHERGDVPTKFIAEFDESKAITAGHTGKNVIMTSENTKYIRVTFYRYLPDGVTPIEIFTVVKGETPNPNALREAFIPQSVILFEKGKTGGDVVQTTGDSETAVMSQKAVTDLHNDLFEFRCKNYLDPSKRKTGFLYQDGSVLTGGSYDAYSYFEEYIPVSEGDVISRQYTKSNGERVSSANASGIFATFVAYDQDKNPLPEAYIKNVHTYTVPAGVAYINFTVRNDQLDTVIDNMTVLVNEKEVLPFFEYGDTYGVFASKYLPEVEASSENSITAFLPDEIVCAVGRTIEIYNSQVCPNADKYHFRWNCEVGKALKRKFSITGTSALVGNRNLTLEIYNDNLAMVYTKTVTLKIVSDTISSTKTICPIGDSLSCHKYWLKEVNNLNANISYVGTREGTTYDTSVSPVQAYTVHHEGRSGWTSNYYLQEKAYTYEGDEGVHPFWDATNSKFSWSYYKTNSGLSPDAVQIFLGTNDLAGGVSADVFAANIKTMVDDIRSADSTIPIFIVLTICWGNQNGVGNQTSTDGFASQKGRFKYDLDCTTINGMQTLYDTLKSYTNLYFIPLTQCHDSEYNFGAVETPVNPRATQTEPMPTEAVHPKQQGYEQMADVMYSVYCQAFEQ